MPRKDPNRIRYDAGKNGTETLGGLRIELARCRYADIRLQGFQIEVFLDRDHGRDSVTFMVRSRSKFRWPVFATGNHSSRFGPFLRRLAGRFGACRFRKYSK